MLAIEKANILLNEFFSEYSCTTIKTTDITGNHGNLHMGVFVESDFFRGKMIFEQHQIIMNILKDLLKTEIHAVKIKTAIKNI